MKIKLLPIILEKISVSGSEVPRKETRRNAKIRKEIIKNKLPKKILMIVFSVPVELKLKKHLRRNAIINEDGVAIIK
ncbi:hypothetical protein [Commensalibacter communis]|uniref:hypothetical protein n=1 Tax=Commensalibacter communis TaxID=2972786 RepID=UPI00232EACD3|nr:hypothetical protein [Commensalibacter communis]